MKCEEFIYYMSNFCNFKPTHLEELTNFIKAYTNDLWNINGLDKKDYIIYLSGPVSGIKNYLDRFKEMEYEVYKAFSAHNIFVINPAILLNSIDHLEFDYQDKIFITLSLLYNCNLLVYDNRDDKYKTSVGTNIELAYAMAKEILIYKYDDVCNMNTFKDGLILYPASNIVQFLQRNNKEILEDLHKKHNIVESDDEEKVEKEENKNETEL